MGDEMFLIEKGTVTLERMRHLGPGNSSTSTHGPLDQGKCADIHIFVCALMFTCFPCVLCYQNPFMLSLLQGAGAGACFVYAYVCT